MNVVVHLPHQVNGKLCEICCTGFKKNCELPDGQDITLDKESEGNWINTWVNIQWYCEMWCGIDSDNNWYY